VAYNFTSTIALIALFNIFVSSSVTATHYLLSFFFVTAALSPHMIFVSLLQAERLFIAFLLTGWASGPVSVHAYIAALDSCSVVVKMCKFSSYAVLHS